MNIKEIEFVVENIFDKCCHLTAIYSTNLLKEMK